MGVWDLCYMPNLSQDKPLFMLFICNISQKNWDWVYIQNFPNCRKSKRLTIHNISSVFYFCNTLNDIAMIKQHLKFEQTYSWSAYVNGLHCVWHDVGSSRIMTVKIIQKLPNCILMALCVISFTYSFLFNTTNGAIMMKAKKLDEKKGSQTKSIL